MMYLKLRNTFPFLFFFIVTLNLQHADLSNDLCDGLFRLNGGAGYVLKPQILRKGILTKSTAIAIACVLCYIKVNFT